MEQEFVWRLKRIGGLTILLNLTRFWMYIQRFKKNSTTAPVAANAGTIDFLATVAQTLGLDVNKTNNSNVGRPIRLVDVGAKPITEVLS